MKIWIFGITGIAVLAVIITILSFVFPGFGTAVLSLFLNFEKGVEGIKQVLVSSGPWVYPLYILLVYLSGLLPTPDSPFIIAGGAIFGLWLAFILTSIANIAGFLTNYFIAKKLGSEWVHKRFPQAMEMVEDFEAKYGWQSILVFRLAPILPFDWVSYVCGLSRVNFVTYCVASYVGNIPGILAATMLGAGFGSGSLLLTSTSIIFLILLVVISNLVLHSQSKLRYIHQKNQQKKA